MKHFYILIPLFLSLNFNLYGQNNDEGKSSNEGSNDFRFRINAGMTLSNTIGKGTVEDSFINGYPPDCYTNSSAARHFIPGKKLGIGFMKDLNEKFSIGLDINYEEKGCRIPISFLSYRINTNGTSELIQQEVDEKSNIKLKYIVLPLKLETRLKKLFIESGIYSGILLDADDYGKINGVRFERDKDGRYSLLDIGVVIGLGKRIPLSAKSNLILAINGNWNLTGNDGRGMIPGYGYHWYNQSFSLDVRYER